MSDQQRYEGSSSTPEPGRTSNALRLTVGTLMLIRDVLERAIDDNEQDNPDQLQQLGSQAANAGIPPSAQELEDAFNAGGLDALLNTKGERAPESETLLERQYLLGYINASDEILKARSVLDDIDSSPSSSPGTGEMDLDEEPAHQPALTEREIKIEEDEEAARRALRSPSPSAHSMQAHEDPGHERATALREATEEAQRPTTYLPPDNAPAPRPPRHTAPLQGPFFLTPHANVPRPAGVDRRSLSRNWEPRQRQYLFSLGERGAWMRTEKKLSPVRLRQYFALLVEICKRFFPNQTPVEVIAPVANAQGRQAANVFLHGSEQQIAFLTQVSMWSSPWMCFQVFPNEDLPDEIVCTFSGAQIDLRERATVRLAFETALRANAAFCGFMRMYGEDPETYIKSARLDFLLLREGGRDARFWNIHVLCPTKDESARRALLDVVANTRPSLNLYKPLRAYPMRFLCSTCDCPTHPSVLCPTLSDAGWMGAVPWPHINKRSSGNRFYGTGAEHVKPRSRPKPNNDVEGSRREAAIKSARARAAKRNQLAQHDRR
ncbi:hypothetical protein AURDEDRAFT_172097 [Auricularia subglabra TFB-10046 SS5]|nr:hypothetical protein AURDEDRAFT_172097 [Auricularia subglabra TFB-10046 SS5]